MILKQAYNHFEYGEMLATKLKPISHSPTDKHFFRATQQDELEELTERISAASGTILIAIDGTQSSLDASKADSLMEQPLYYFAVVQQTDSTNSTTIFEAQSKCKKILIQIVSKMLQDAYINKSGLALLDKSSFLMKGFGPIADNFFGVLMSFSLNEGLNFKLNPEMWEV